MPTDLESRILAACRTLHARGVYPSAAAIRLVLGDPAPCESAIGEARNALVAAGRLALGRVRWSPYAGRRGVGRPRSLTDSPADRAAIEARIRMARLALGRGRNPLAVLDAGPFTIQDASPRLAGYLLGLAARKAARGRLALLQGAYA